MKIFIAFFAFACGALAGFAQAHLVKAYWLIIALAIGTVVGFLISSLIFWAVCRECDEVKQRHGG